MNPAAIGHIAAGIVRGISILVRIDDLDREKTIIVTDGSTAIDWASLTFVGQRHALALRLEGEADAVAAALARIEAGLADADMPLAGHFIASIALVSKAPPEPLMSGHVAQAFRIEALVLRD